ncbi:MAG: hypothetical protein ACP5TL_00855 [Candidatus Micrarchaeia archaeon]
MREFNYFFTAILLLLLLSTVSYAQYWFQSGARSSADASYNNGASVSIKTVYQNVTFGSFGFWVGEDLSNGAFAQVGYEINNQSGYYPTNCSASGCTGRTFIEAGTPTWFWEYFPANYYGGQFYGSIGPNGSAGPNNTYNTYSFISNGTEWNFYFNDMLIGSTNLGVSESGYGTPSAFGEYADAFSNNVTMKNVTFKNLEFYTGSKFELVPKAYSYIGYGKGSETILPNLYGVKEIDNISNFFEVGSGLPLMNGTLWVLGYNLKVYSDYGNISNESNSYEAYAIARISAPKYIYLGNDSRVVFEKWVGSGFGSYTGSSLNASIRMYDNITEKAVWQLQYYVNVSNSLGDASGTGWYANGTYANISLKTNYAKIGNGERGAFTKWSNGLKNKSITLYVDKPIDISPIWNIQYFVNATSQYGRAIGTGWYNANSTANVYIEEQNITINSTTKEGFYSWSNGNRSKSISFAVTKPTNLTAYYKPMYLITLDPVDEYNKTLSNVTFDINGANYTTKGIFLFSGDNYSIWYVVYNNYSMAINQHISAMKPTTYKVVIPLYNVAIKTKSFFGTPVNATATITFKNGTVINVSTGRNGTIVFHDVPYGYVYGKVSLMGISQAIRASSGANVDVTMLTPFALVMINLGIILLIASIIVVSFFERREKKQKAELE